MQRKNRTYGYFSGNRWKATKGKKTSDEIALNPQHFRYRSTEQTLSTLVHEMAHLWQHHFGKTSRNGYHNKQWAEMMKNLGLIPSDTGKIGGKETGQYMDHYIRTNGAFQFACAKLLKKKFRISWADQSPFAELDDQETKGGTREKYTCPSCEVTAWARRKLFLICGTCDAKMIAGNTANSTVMTMT